jgi:predicted DNA-binding transcriptional regulator AlpA
MPTTPTAEREWLDPLDLASWLGLDVKSVYNLNYNRTGPRFYRIANRVRYRRIDVEKWLAERAVTPETH